MYTYLEKELDITMMHDGLLLLSKYFFRFFRKIFEKGNIFFRFFEKKLFTKKKKPSTLHLLLCSVTNRQYSLAG